MKNIRASVTAEMAILFPLILYILCFIIYNIVLIYQQAYAKTICDAAAVKAANWWQNIERDFDTGLISEDRILNENIYHGIYDLNSEQKKSYVKKYIKNRLYTNTILKPSEFDMQDDINIEVANYIIQKKLYLNVYVQYRLPVPSLIQYFNIPTYYQFNVSSSAYIRDYAGYMNDIDFMIDLYDDAKENSKTITGFHEALDDLKRKVLY